MPYALGPVKQHVRAAAEDIGKRFGIANVLGIGVRANDSDHPKGLALDFMTSDKAKGDALAEFVKANAGAYGVTYVIWWGRIWSVARNGEGWRAYKSPTGLNNKTTRHEDHVHVSFSPTPGTGNPTQVTGNGGASCLPMLAGIFSVGASIAYAFHHFV